jgi:hypothetical protein
MTDQAVVGEPVAVTGNGEGPPAAVPAEDEKYGTATDEPRGNRFVNCLVQCPCIMATVVMSFCILCIVVMMGVIMAEGADIFSQDAVGDINDLRTNAWDGLQMAQEQSRVFARDPGAKMCSGMMGKEKECATGKRPQQTENGDSVLMAYVAKNGELFTPSNLEQMKTVEDKIIKHPGFVDFCKRWDKTGKSTTCSRPLSVLNLFYVNGINTKQAVDQLDAMDGATDGKLDIFATPGLSDAMAVAANGGLEGKTTLTMSEQTAVQVAKVLLPFLIAAATSRGDTQQDVPATLKLAGYMKTVGYLASTVDFYFDKDFSLASPNCKYSRAIIDFGMPLEGYDNQDDNAKKQKTELSDWFKKEFSQYLKDTKEAGDVEVLFFATPLVFDEFIQIILFDVLKVVISITAVFFWLWFQTKSIFIAIVGMVEILLSIPLAFFFYRTIFGFMFFDGLNAMTVFIVVAIGADDIFVFMDAYRQSAYDYNVCSSLKTRMNWVYKRAATAMLATSVTTCAAFICSATTPLVSIQSFGVFSAFVIAADYALVITWFPACVVIYHNLFEKRPNCCACWRCGQMCSKMTTTTATVRQNGPEAAPEKRKLERFFGGPFAKMIRGPFDKGGVLLSKGFAPWIILGMVLLLIPFLLLATSISAVSSSEEGLPNDHPFQRLWTIYGTEFPTTAVTPNTNVYVYWGVQGIDRDGVNLLRDVENRGKLQWDSTFSFDEAAQQHMYNVCREVEMMSGPKVSEFLSRDPDHPLKYGWLKCPVMDWKKWLERTGGPGFPLPLSQVAVEMPKFLASAAQNAWGGSETMKEKWRKHIGFDGTAVRMHMITVRCKLAQRANHNEKKLRAAFDGFEGWIADVNSKHRTTSGAVAPASANKALHTADGDFNGPLWMWMHTQTVFVSSAFLGASMGCIVAFFVLLLFTQQIIIALSAVVTILSVLLSVLAMMKIANYELGTITSISISILAGFAVDFVVHLAHSYAHCDLPTRSEKIQHVFDEIAVSVFSGMLTSVLAAMVLLFCSLQFFAKFGFFLIFTVSWAWIWGNFFFMSIMRCVGPDDSLHWILKLPGSVTEPLFAKWKAALTKPK